MKHFLLKSWLTILCLLVGVSSAWAEEATLSTMATSGTIVTDIITFTTAANGASNPALSSDGTQLRLYANSSANMSTGVKGGSITFTAADGYVINQVILAIANDGNSNTTAGYQVDGTGSWIGSASNVVKNTDYSTDDNLGASTVEIANFGTVTKSNRIYITSITVKYETSGGGGVTKYNVGINPSIVGGSVTASPTSAAKGATVTLTPAANTGYAFDSWSVVDASSNPITVTSNQFTMPASDVSVSATFTALPTYTAQFSINGNIDANDNYVGIESSAITFPSDPADISGKKFVGWTKTADYSNADTEPLDLCKEANMGNADVTYYAVFATSSGSGDELLVKITDGNQVSAGTYVVISYDEAFYLPNALATSSAPTATAVTKTDDVIVIGDAMKWNLSIDDGSYILESASNTGNYLWGANTNEGIRINATSAKSGAFKNWKLNNTNDYGLVLQDNGSTRRYLSTYGTQDWRNYTSTSATNRAANLYKVVLDLEYSNYTTTVIAFNATIPTMGLTTVCLPYAAEITTDGAQAWAVTDIDGNGIHLTAVDALKANRGYIIQGTASSTVTLVKCDEPAEDGNILDGVTERTATSALPIDGTGEYHYPWILNKSNEFIKYTGTELPANKAYLDGGWLYTAGVSLTSTLRVIFEDNEPGIETGVGDIIDEEDVPLIIHTLHGVLVKKVVKDDFYIVNRKSVRYLKAE